MKIKAVEVRIVQADITELKVDAIVNAANNKLLMGGGVAGAIKKRGGSRIEDEAVKKGPIEIGEAVWTSAGSLPSKYVIHAATMGMDFKTDENKIRSSCASSLKVAGGLKAGSLAFPALGCGVGGFALVACAKIMAQEVYRHIKDNPDTSIKEIVFCLYDKKAYEVFNQHVLGYLGHLVNVLESGPFVTVDAIIEMQGAVVLIERSNPPFGWALPGGFVDYGESLEEAARREAREETGLELKDMRQFHTYSAPGRDPRFHTIGTVFIASADGALKAGDDAAGAKLVKAEDLCGMEFAFDHKKILLDYLEYKKTGTLPR